MANISINSHFDSGNIEIIDLSDASNIQLAIPNDSNSEFLQWFHFHVQVEPGTECRFRLTNAKDAAYVKGWEGYQAVASYDREHWFRVPTDYVDGELVISHTPDEHSIYYAYFTPYSYERHLDLLATAQASELCDLEQLGETVDGRLLSVLNIGQPSEKPPVWIIARQHPGESMAEWLIEGLLSRLLDEEDPIARELLSEYAFRVVPNMNPDGSVRGNLRANAAGKNLNREWLEPTMEGSPEVYLVRQKMLETGVSLFLDVHGDEAIPYNFLAGCEGIPSYDERHKMLEDTFKRSFLSASPDFQVTHGYDEDAPGQANMTMATTWVGEQFNCLSYTLEMPFKDNDNLPDPECGWSASRSMKLGEALLQPILETLKVS